MLPKPGAGTLVAGQLPAVGPTPAGQKRSCLCFVNWSRAAGSHQAANESGTDSAAPGTGC